MPARCHRPRPTLQLLAAAAALLVSAVALGDGDMNRPDGHAPIGIMGDHAHQRGGWMLSYRYMRMEMDGNRDGSSRVSADSVLDDFMVTPTRMTMEMHMLGLMYAPGDRLTLMAMLPYKRLVMDHRTRRGGTFTTVSEGIGDVALSALVRAWAGADSELVLGAGLSAPTGSITERDTTPAGPRQKLPYPMQLGSGTWDLQPSLTWTRRLQDGSWGAQLSARIRLGENDQHYTLGDLWQASLWGAWRATPSVSLSARLQAQRWGDIKGADPDLNPALIPTADPHRRGGRQLTLAPGINWLGRAGALRGHRLGLELLVPVHRHLDGPQLETDWTLMAGWQRAIR